MGPGGSIKQIIKRDPYEPDVWETEKMILFNLQLVDASYFKQPLGIEPPETPITAATYAQHGYPFFKLYQQPTGVHNSFDLNSVGYLDKQSGAHESVHQVEANFGFPSIDLDWNVRNVSLNSTHQKGTFIPIRLKERAKGKS